MHEKGLKRAIFEVEFVPVVLNSDGTCWQNSDCSLVKHVRRATKDLLNIEMCDCSSIINIYLNTNIKKIYSIYIRSVMNFEE